VEDGGGRDVTAGDPGDGVGDAAGDVVGEVVVCVPGGPGDEVDAAATTWSGRSPARVTTESPAAPAIAAAATATTLRLMPPSSGGNP